MLFSLYSVTACMLVSKKKNTFPLTRSLNSSVVLMMTPDTLKDSRYEPLGLLLLKYGKEDRINWKEPFCARPHET